MNKTPPKSYTCFDGNRRIGAGSLQTVALVVKRGIENGAIGPVLIFDDTTGCSIDINTRGSDEEVVARLATGTNDRSELARPGQSQPTSAFDGNAAPSPDESRGRGRPKLGVVAREVTLLPRHWEWLATQSGGASVALRKLVEEARRTHGDKDRIREAHERAYRFMSAMAGDLQGFEEATRALFANDQSRFSRLIEAWPPDVRDHAFKLAFGEWKGSLL